LGAGVRTQAREQPVWTRWYPPRSPRTCRPGEHLEALDSVVDDVQERLLAPLSESERRQFITLMRRIATGEA
jgi:hypothetical protein